MGLISSAEIADSDARHVLIRSLGPEMFISPDTTAVTLQAGDVLVLCTDGLHDEMSEAAIAEIVSQKKNTDEIARELVTKPWRSTGATIPLRRLSGSGLWSRWACIVAAHTCSPNEPQASGIQHMRSPLIR